MTILLLIYEKDYSYKARIYEYIFFKNEEISFLELSQVFSLHISTIKRYLWDLQTIDFLENELFFSKTSVRCSKKNILPLDLTTHFKINGIFIKLLKLIYTNKYLTMDGIARQLNMSSSHLYKIIRELNTRIEIFDLKLQVYPNIGLKGDELSIAYLKWLVISMCPSEQQVFTYEIQKFQQDFCTLFDIDISKQFNYKNSYYYYYKWLLTIKRLDGIQSIKLSKIMSPQSSFSKCLEEKISILLKKYHINTSQELVCLACLGLFFFKINFGNSLNKLKFFSQKNTPEFSGISENKARNLQGLLNIPKHFLPIISLVFSYETVFILDLKLEGTFSYLHYFQEYNFIKRKISTIVMENCNKQFYNLENIIELLSVLTFYCEQTKISIPKFKILIESSLGNEQQLELLDHLKSIVEFVEYATEQEKCDIIIRDDLRFSMKSDVSMYTIAEFLIKLDKFFNEFRASNTV